MIYHEFTPAAPLGQYIQCLWYCEGYAAAHARERVLPSGAVELVFALARDWLTTPVGKLLHEVERGAPATVVGAFSRYQTIATVDLERIAGVHFRPGCAAAFLEHPASCVADLEVSLEDLWGARARGIAARLREQRDAAGVFQVLQQILLERVAPEPDGLACTRWATAEILREPRAARIAGIAERAGLSQKQLVTLFRWQVGVSPKRFARVARFRQALAAAASGRATRWADLALECGYYDQAHFIKDFQEFAGINPSDFEDLRTAWTSHLVAPA